MCESGVTLAKNFERLLSPGPGSSPASSVIDSDMLTQSVATWELAHKVATADSNGNRGFEIYVDILMIKF